LKNFGWHQTSSNDEGGVAAAIERFALRDAAPCGPVEMREAAS